MKNFRELLSESVEDVPAPKEKTVPDLKPAVVILGPDHVRQEWISQEYARRLEGYGFSTYSLSPGERVGSACEYFRKDDTIDPEKIYALGIFQDNEGLYRILEEEASVKGITLVYGSCQPHETLQVKIPTIMIQCGKKDCTYEQARDAYDRVFTGEKMVIWEESTEPSQYLEDARMMDRTAKSAFRWFKMHAAFPPEEEE